MKHGYRRTETCCISFSGLDPTGHLVLKAVSRILLHYRCKCRSDYMRQFLIPLFLWRIRQTAQSAPLIEFSGKIDWQWLRSGEHRLVRNGSGGVTLDARIWVLGSKTVLMIVQHCIKYRYNRNSEAAIAVGWKIFPCGISMEGRLVSVKWAAIRWTWLGDSIKVILSAAAMNFGKFMGFLLSI